MQNDSKHLSSKYRRVFVSLTNLIVDGREQRDTASRDSTDLFARLVWLMTILCYTTLS